MANMKKASLLLASFLSIGAAFAQNAPLTGISESTDPGKVAEVERRAQELQSAAQQQGTSSRAEERSVAPKTKATKHRKMRKGKMHRSPGGA